MWSEGRPEAAGAAAPCAHHSTSGPAEPESLRTASNGGLPLGMRSLTAQVTLVSSDRKSAWCLVGESPDVRKKKKNFLAEDPAARKPQRGPSFSAEPAYGVCIRRRHSNGVCRAIGLKRQSGSHGGLTPCGAVCWSGCAAHTQPYSLLGKGLRAAHWSVGCVAPESPQSHQRCT